MGLDQYLYAEKYYSYYSCDTDEKRENFKKIVDIVEATDYIEQEYTSAIVRVKVAQWRKANQIHGWFVRNCQGGEDDCRDSYVGMDKLKELKTLCELVLASPSKADELLPVTEGFFFGSNEYDTYYLNDLQTTIEIIEKLEKMGDEWSFVYSSSW